MDVAFHRVAYSRGNRYPATVGEGVILQPLPVIKVLASSRQIILIQDQRRRKGKERREVSRINNLEGTHREASLVEDSSLGQANLIHLQIIIITTSRRKTLKKRVLTKLSKKLKELFLNPPLISSFLIKEPSQATIKQLLSALMAPLITFF